MINPQYLELAAFLVVMLLRSKDLTYEKKEIELFSVVRFNSKSVNVGSE